MEKQTFDHWEKQTGFFAYERSQFGSKQLTKAEFLDIFRNRQGDFHMVNIKDREKFLKDNGYELSRENLIDPELSAKPKPEE